MRTELPSLCPEIRRIAFNLFLFGLWSSRCLPWTKCADPSIFCVEFIVPCIGLIAHSKQFIWCLVLGFFIGKIRQWWPLKDLNRDKLRAPFEGNLHLHLHLIALLNIFYLLNPPSRIPLSVASLRIFSGRRFTHKGFNIMLPRSKFISAMFIVTFLSST